jgi:hypothetical protein
MRAFEQTESALGERSLRSLRRGLLKILAIPLPGTDHEVESAG